MAERKTLQSEHATQQKWSSASEGGPYQQEGDGPVTAGLNNTECDTQRVTSSPQLVVPTYDDSYEWDDMENIPGDSPREQSRSREREKARNDGENWRGKTTPHESHRSHVTSRSQRRSHAMSSYRQKRNARRGWEDPRQNYGQLPSYQWYHPGHHPGYQPLPHQFPAVSL